MPTIERAKCVVGAFRASVGIRSRVVRYHRHLRIAHLDKNVTDELLGAVERNHSSPGCVAARFTPTSSWAWQRRHAVCAVAAQVDWWGICWIVHGTTFRVWSFHINHIAFGQLSTLESCTKCRVHYFG